ncbi:single-stranded DNA-binding protein [Desulfocurvus sp. DL9XJH121]
MASLNRVMLIGRLGVDPELRYTQSGQPVANFRMATDESYRGQDGNMVERTEWHRIVVWGRQAEPVANYLHKGSMVYVEGSLQTQKWQAKDGSDRYTTEIKAMRVQFLDPKSAGQGGYDGPRAQGAPQQGGNRRPAPAPQGGGYEDEDLGPAFPSEASGMDDVPF